MMHRVYECRQCGNTIDSMRVDRHLLGSDGRPVVVVPCRVLCGRCDIEMTIKSE